jgi:hypothetical protein
VKPRPRLRFEPLYRPPLLKRQLDGFCLRHRGSRTPPNVVVEGLGVGLAVVTRWVVAVRPTAHPTRRYKYVAADTLTTEVAEATRLDTLDAAMILASQVRLLAGDAYRVEVLEAPALQG